MESRRGRFSICTARQRLLPPGSMAMALLQTATAGQADAPAVAERKVKLPSF